MKAEQLFHAGPSFWGRPFPLPDNLPHQHPFLIDKIDLRHPAPDSVSIHRIFLQQQQDGKGDLVLIDDFLGCPLSLSINGDQNDRQLISLILGKFFKSYQLFSASLSPSGPKNDEHRLFSEVSEGN